MVIPIWEAVDDQVIVAEDSIAQLRTIRKQEKSDLSIGTLDDAANRR